MDAALIYELSDPSADSRIVVELIQLGYNTSWRTDQGTVKYTLPKGMLWKVNITFSDALKDIKTACDRLNTATVGLNLKIVHCIVLDTANWAGIPDSAQG